MLQGLPAPSALELLALQRSDTKTQKHGPAHRKIRGFQFRERPFQRPALGARSKAPDLSPHFGPADRGVPKPCGKAHPPDLFAPPEDFPKSRSVAARKGFVCFGLRASRLVLFRPLAIVTPSCHRRASEAAKSKLSSTSLLRDSGEDGSEKPINSRLGVSSWIEHRSSCQPAVA